MALYSMLRRASSSVLPLAIRAVGSPRPLRHVLSRALAAEKGELAQTLSGRSFVPALHFSTSSTDSSLVQVVESEIKCAEEDRGEESLGNPPEDFPFKIEDRPGERTITLTRNYQDEVIKVEVDIPQTGDEDEDDDDDDEDNDDENLEGTLDSIPLFVTVTKGNGISLQFGVSASDDSIDIDSLSIKQPGASEDDIAYEGPDFNDLDENLRKAFLKYLEIRGINFATANFLNLYMRIKENKEYLLWLKNIKNFIEK